MSSRGSARLFVRKIARFRQESGSNCARHHRLTAACQMPLGSTNRRGAEESREGLRCDLLFQQLVVPAYARGAAVSQNFDGCLGTFVLGSDQQELPAMRESHRVGFDNFVGQAIVGQMGLKGPNDRLMIWLTMGGCFGRSPNRRRSRNLERRRARDYALLQQ